MKNEKIIIDHELYGLRSEFGSIEAAQSGIRACGPDFATTRLEIHYDIVVDERGNHVGDVVELEVAK